MSFPKTILIVDDDMNVLEVLEARLLSNDFRVLKASDALQAIQLLNSNPVDVMISDIKMPGMGGMDLFTEIKSSHPNLPVIFLTAYGTIQDAVNAMKAGAVDYIAKPFDGQTLLKKLRKIIKETPSEQAIPSPEMVDPKNTIGICSEQSASMKELNGLIARVAVSNVSVLILGESGSGKEYAALKIHQQSPRQENPFVVVDCGSTPAGLLETELFGHAKGAFTHAVRDKRGLIEEADQGTLFLDEIGNISQEMQTRLLRFLEDRKIRRIGELREIPVDCRVIAATNSDLTEDIRDGRFREDLYYRLRVVTLTVPPLRERKEDITGLARHFITSFCQSNGLPQVEIPSETMSWLREYPWPGNVRELKNAIEAGVVLCRNNILYPSDLLLSGLPDISAGLSPDPDSFTLKDSEYHTILRALKQTGGVQKDAAELLGISRRAIHYKIKKYGINTSQIRSAGKKTAW
ncbi:MAG: sigma-54-dependent Fis family transcriptional regulator [Desulfobacteraceae bacterium]|nr:MAG: sigma-54-dependent Fis family transcriptional regulator [Desulfobacteraceae bacterium]